MNPDPNGPPWWSGGGTLPTPEEEALITRLFLTPESSAVALPSEVYNDQLDFFPPIFYQNGQGCVHAAEIGYTFTYEINRIRNVEAGNWTTNKDNCYHHLFTYNFKNDGNGSNFSEYTSGFQIIKQAGCPSYSIYYDTVINQNGGNKFKYWMTGYDNYYTSMSNAIDGYSHINFGYSYESLDTLKHWIADHNEGSDTGGLATIRVLTELWTIDNIPMGTPHENEEILIELGTDTLSGHEMTIVGYDDTVRFDFNNDGLFTVDVDLNGDSIINLLDREYGAFKVANSWDVWFGNYGFIWLPYKVMPGQLDGHNRAYVCHVQGEYKPAITIKTNIEHPNRKNLRFIVGFGENADIIFPSDSNRTDLKYFNYQGGEYDMRGSYTGPIEIGLDFGYWYLEEDFGKIFFIIREIDDEPWDTGFVNQFSIIDYRWNEIFELECEADFPYEIWNNAYTKLSVDYDLIVPGDDQLIVENTSLFSNMVSRFNPTVANSVTLTVEDGVEIDMYNSSLIINEGGTLVIEDDAIFTGENGECNILVYGDIQVGLNVTFNKVDITIYNGTHQTTFQNCTFNGSALINGGAGLNISNSSFNECVALWSIKGDVTISGSDFNCTWLLLENMAGDLTSSVNISSNDFVGNSGCQSGVYIQDYDYFGIEDNSLDNCGIGIQVYESGSGASGNQNIFENEIMNCDDKGILVYNSTASIAGNNIYGNNNGVWLANSSNVALLGNASAQSYSETQQIKDNTVYEVYSSRHSFPWYFRYNAIIDEDNTGNPVDPLLYFDSPCTQQRDIRYNCWGNNFNASEDFYPSICFLYTPTWCPPNSAIESSAAEQLYITANTQFEAGNYAEAQTSYRSVINLYPDTDFAQASIRDLFSLEMFIGDDYAGLKQYYNTNTTIQSDSTLTELAVFFSNKCDVQLENWQAAIDHYESIINDPPTSEDSIYAIIDLGYTYTLMQNSGYKSFYSGNMTEHIPASIEQFRDRREYHLSLFPLSKEVINDAQPENQAAGQLLQNIPNPFSNSTKVYYEIFEEGVIKIGVYNHLGSEVWEIEKQNSIGKNSVEFNADDLPAGIYFYVLSVNGKVADSKKMILVK